MSYHSGWLLERTDAGPGSFEMLVACQPPARGLVHLLCDSVVPFTRPEIWREAGRIRASSFVRPLHGAALIRSNYGNLEAVAADTGGALAHFWKSSQAGWRGPTVMSPDQAAGSPAFLQSGFGTRGNFEVIVPRRGGGLAHFWRDNDRGANVVWHEAPNRPFAAGDWTGVAVIHSGFGNLEVVGVCAGNLFFLWQNGPGGVWSPARNIGTGIIGRPAFIQSTYGNAGNFEVVAAMENGGLMHRSRNNDAPLFPWSQPVAVGPASIKFDDVTLLQNSSGALEVTARVAGRAAYKRFRRVTPDAAWDGPIGGPVIQCDA
jgi:hypothetical protein